MSCLLLAACSAAPAGKTETHEDFSDIFDTKSDAFSRRWQMLGAIESGKPQTIQYANPPRFRAFTYNAVAHPELSGSDYVLISYNLNSSDPSDLYSSPELYRPRFVRAGLSCFGS